MKTSSIKEMRKVAADALYDTANDILTQLHRHAIQHAVAGSAITGWAEYQADEGKIIITAELSVTQVDTNMKWQKFTGESTEIGWPAAIRLITKRLARLVDKTS